MAPLEEDVGPLAGPLGTLALSALRPSAPASLDRAFAWAEGLAVIGLHPPLVVVHDLGLVLAGPPAERVLGPRTSRERVSGWPVPHQQAWAAQQDLVTDLAMLAPLDEGTARRPLGGPHDGWVVAVLARILSPVAQELAEPAPYSRLPRSPIEASSRALEPRLASLFLALPRAHDLAALAALAKARLRVLCLAAALDASVLRWLSGPDAPTLDGEGSPRAQGRPAAAGTVDLAVALAGPVAADAARLALELLPSAREGAPARQPAAREGQGLEGLSRRGSLDALLLTELAWDDEELSRRAADGEALYYAREEAPDEARPLHAVVVDATASLRGARAPFARALALSMGAALRARGDDVSFRFFDARLHEERRASPRSLPAAYLLAFQGERGRHTRAVLLELAAVARRLRVREGRPLVVHLITHAALGAARADVEALGRDARVFVTFLRAGRPPAAGERTAAPALAFADLLAGHAWIDVDPYGAAARVTRPEDATALACAHALGSAPRR